MHFYHRHIGENTAQILDRRLKEFRDVNGRDPLLDEVMNQAERTAWRNQLKRNGCSDGKLANLMLHVNWIFFHVQVMKSSENSSIIHTLANTDDSFSLIINYCVTAEICC